MASGLFEAHKKEDCEAHTTRLMGAWLEKLTDRMVTHIKAAMETRRHPNGYSEPDYERELREREGGEFRMGNYHEGGGRDKWIIPGLVTLAVSGIIGNVVQSMTVAALRQEVSDLQRQVDKIEKLIEPRYRGAP